MRPTPQELVDGVRRLLRDVVAPELTSAHAKHRLAEIRSGLAQVDWDDAGLRLRREVVTRRSLLEELQQWWMTDPSARPPAEVSELVRLALDGETADTFRAVAAQHDVVGAALAAVVGPLADHVAKRPQDVTAGALQARLVDLLA